MDKFCLNIRFFIDFRSIDRGFDIVVLSEIFWTLTVIKDIMYVPNGYSSSPEKFDRGLLKNQNNTCLIQDSTAADKPVCTYLIP